MRGRFLSKSDISHTGQRARMILTELRLAVIWHRDLNLAKQISAQEPGMQAFVTVG